MWKFIDGTYIKDAHSMYFVMIPIDVPSTFGPLSIIYSSMANNVKAII